MADDHQAALEYCRGVYSATLDWYKVSDAKGQLLLTLNGIYITILSSALLLRPEDLSTRKSTLGVSGWILFGGAASATAASIASALMCLRSRLSVAELNRHREFFSERAVDGAASYRPAVTFWFGTLAGLDPSIALPMFRDANASFEVEALSEEILLLAPNVLHKHRWVNRGWACAGTSLFLLLMAVASVVIAA